MKKTLAKVLSRFRSGDRFTGCVSVNGIEMTKDFDEWIKDKMKQYREQTVTITIEISPQQNVKVIESKKEFSQLVYA